MPCRDDGIRDLHGRQAEIAGALGEAVWSQDLRGVGDLETRDCDSRGRAVIHALVATRTVAGRGDCEAVGVQEDLQVIDFLTIRADFQGIREERYGAGGGRTSGIWRADEAGRTIGRLLRNGCGTS